MIRMLIVGYRFGIRSERRLCEEVHLNPAYRRFCRLGLDGAFPTTRPSERIGTAAFATATCCAGCLRPCCSAALMVGGEGFAVNASLIEADASDRTRVQGSEGLPPGAAGRAVEEYLAVLDDAAFGAATEVTPKFIAPGDPATRWTAAHRGPAFFVYSVN